LTGSTCKPVPVDSQLFHQNAIAFAFQKVEC
jgi:hypothetical protein